MGIYLRTLGAVSPRVLLCLPTCGDRAGTYTTRAYREPCRANGRAGRDIRMTSKSLPAPGTKLAQHMYCSCPEILMAQSVFYEEQWLYWLPHFNREKMRLEYSLHYYPIGGCKLHDPRPEFETPVTL